MPSVRILLPSLIIHLVWRPTVCAPPLIAKFGIPSVFISSTMSLGNTKGDHNFRARKCIADTMICATIKVVVVRNEIYTVAYYTVIYY